MTSTHNSHSVSRMSARLIALFIPVVLAGCGSDGPVKQAVGLTGFATTPAEPAQFVRDQRPQSTQYLPIGAAPPARDKIKSQDDVKQTEAAMDSLRTGNEAKATTAKALGATPAPTVPKVPPLTN